MRVLIAEIEAWLAAHPSVVWAASLAGCLALIAIGQEAKAALCLEKLVIEFHVCHDPITGEICTLIEALVARILGGSTVPTVCVPKHSSTVQGAGLCCQQVGAGLTAPPPGTVLPVYQKGQAASLPPGRIVGVTDSGGHCASCMIVGSTSPKHPGRPVLKFIRGGPSCPTSRSGCCSL